MIVTLTCNPAIDKTACVERVAPRTLHRLTAVRQDIGGKGVNVSRTVAALGGQSIACGFAAGESGCFIKEALEKQGISADFVELTGQTRTNLKLVEPDGSLTEFNEPGPAAAPADVEALAARLEGHARPGTVFVLAGSVGPGVPANLYARLTGRLQARGAKVLVDADGPLLAQALQAAEKPNFLKPNLYELAQLLGKDPAALDLPAMAAGIASLLRQGVESVCVSLGADGAAFFTPAGAWHAAALPVPVRSTVGAGDAMAAALALGAGSGLPPLETFRLAMAAAAAACAAPGTQPPDPAQVRALLPHVQMQEL